jgi:hypothetical protein
VAPAAAALPSEWGLRMLHRPPSARRRAAADSPGEEPPCASKSTTVTELGKTFGSGFSADSMAATTAGSCIDPDYAAAHVDKTAVADAADDLEALLDRLQLSSDRPTSSPRPAAAVNEDCTVDGAPATMQTLLLSGCDGSSRALCTRSWCRAVSLRGRSCAALSDQEQPVCVTGVAPLKMSNADAAAAGVLEAVEVKNTCPFQQVAWVTASGKRRTSYVLSDRGPRSEARTLCRLHVNGADPAQRCVTMAPCRGLLH